MVQRKVLPLIDRTAELQRLRDALDHTRVRGCGQGVLLAGPRGVGKSRLAEAFLQHCREVGTTVLRADCAGEAAEPLLPVRDALRAELGTSTRAVGGALRKGAPELLGLVPVVGTFLTAVGKELTQGPAIGGSNPHGVYDVLADLMLRLGGEGGLCLFLEDLHLADPDTLAFLTYFLNRSRDTPTLTLLTLPEEERESAHLATPLYEWREKGLEVLDLPPFGRRHIDELVREFLGSERLADHVLDLAEDWTGGNPLLLTEGLHELVSAHAVSVVRGEARFVRPPSAVPVGVEDLLRARLARLPPAARQLVRAAAVVGVTAQDLTPVLEVVTLDERAALEALDQARRAGALLERPDGRIAFSSELLRLTAYGEIPGHERVSLHRRTGTWFEAAGRWSEAAHHFDQAGDTERMVACAWRAAEAAEHSGMHEACVRWYRRLQGRADPDLVLPRLCRALLAVGEWEAAEEVLGQVSPQHPERAFLRSDLLFVRGSISAAAQLLDQVLQSDVEDLPALLRSGELQLYLGRFGEALRLADRAVVAAEAGGDPCDLARALVVQGATRLYLADLDASADAFDRGLAVVAGCPERERNLSVYSALLGNRGFVDEFRADWSSARTYHERALELRRTVGDARGVLETCLALGRVALGAGDLDAAERQLLESERYATHLGEHLQHAKVVHTLGSVAHARGDSARAVELMREAVREFSTCGTSYDVALVHLSLARVLEDSGDTRAATCHRASGRAAVERGGFELLRRVFPEVSPTSEQRVLAGLLAFSAGDALGLPWEGRPPSEVREHELELLPATELWASGDTSDDTALSLLVARHLVDTGGHVDPLAFLAELSDRADVTPGLGPSTQLAVAAFRKHGTAAPNASDTNGAAMRALPVGWAHGLDSVRRRADVIALSRPTHGGRDAQVAACVVAACASWALEGAPGSDLVAVGLEEAYLAALALGPGENAVAEALEQVSGGQWVPPPAGVSLSPVETVAAVLHCCQEAGDSLLNALRLAVRLGGDTDTVAALVGGLLGCRHAPDEVEAALPWLREVHLAPRPELQALAAGLARLRSVARG